MTMIGYARTSTIEQERRHQMIIVKSDNKFVTDRGVTGFDWTDKLGLAARFTDEKSAKAALRTLGWNGWNSRMKDAVQFLRVSESK